MAPYLCRTQAGSLLCLFLNLVGGDAHDKRFTSLASLASLIHGLIHGLVHALASLVFVLHGHSSILLLLLLLLLFLLFLLLLFFFLIIMRNPAGLLGALLRFLLLWRVELVGLPRARGNAVLLEVCQHVAPHGGGVCGTCSAHPPGRSEPLLTSNPTDFPSHFPSLSPFLVTLLDTPLHLNNLPHGEAAHAGPPPGRGPLGGTLGRTE